MFMDSNDKKARKDKQPKESQVMEELVKVNLL